MCVESEQPSYIFYYICDLFYQYLSEFFACLLHTLHNQYTANIYNVTNPVFCCVPFFSLLPLHFSHLIAAPSAAQNSVHCFLHTVTKVSNNSAVIFAIIAQSTVLDYAVYHIYCKWQ